MRHLKNVVEAICMLQEEEIHKAVGMLKSAKERGAFVWIIGNGGSAATAEHFANDLFKMCGIKACSVPSMGATILAYGNDEGWERMFANPLRKLAAVGDVVVAISCSGNSPNIVNAVKDIRHKCEVIGMTGPGLNELSEMYPADVKALVRAYADDIKVQEDIHLIVCHAIAGLINE